MNKLGVRSATSDDAPGIAAVHVGTWKVAYRGQVPDDVLDGMSVEKRTEAWRELLASPEGHNTLVAENKGELIGFANAGPSRDEDASGSVGEVYAIYVLPDHWGTGAGAALIQRALEHLRPLFDSATLWVLASNERGRSFYERGGWEPDGASQPLEGLGGVIEVRYRISL